MNRKCKHLSIIIPTFNEQGNINKIYGEIVKNLPLKIKYEIIFINDGSTDGSLDLISKLANKFSEVKYLSFSRNFGHQAALKAGLDYSVGDCVISMDCDLQHPPVLIKKMISLWEEGYDVVYTKKKDYHASTYRKVTTSVFYMFINKLTDIKLDYGAADFRLLDRKVVDVLKNMDESVLFLRGLISWCGFSQYAIEYVPEERFSGKSNYTFKKLFLFALNGITSFSVRPLQFSTYIGFLLSFLSGTYAVFAITMHFLNKSILSGWTSVILSTLFLGGIQLLILGIMGEYLGKLFIEVKKRPVYILNGKNIKK